MVEDVSTELKRNPRARTAGVDVAEESGGDVVEGDDGKQFGQKRG